MKKILSLTLIIIAILTAGKLNAQRNNEKLLDGLFASTGEIYFKFNVNEKNEVDRLSSVISIDNYKNSEVYAYANRKEFSRFLDYHYTYTILPNPSSLLSESELNMGNINKGPGSRTIWNFYPTYQQYLDFMAGFASTYPDICKIDTIGTTYQNRLLLAVKISDSVNYVRDVPKFLYTSSIHGDELTGFVMMMHLIDSLLSGYNNSTRITDMIKNTAIYINPLANPDGTYHGGNNTVMGATRYNAHSVDMNRNYPDPADGPHPDGNSWQQETVNFMNFAGINHFVTSINFHGGEEVFNYPWDTWSRLNADDAWWQFVAREWADTVHHYGPAGYMTDEMNGITNGYAWYRITGGRQDYMNYFRLSREATLEISSIKTPPASQLIGFWNYNYHSFLNYIEEVNFGINGKVTDTVTGEPLAAKVFIPSHDIDSTFVYSYLPTGWYYRPIYHGTWTLNFTCPGYFPKTISNVTVTDRTTTRLNVKMIPLNIGGTGNQIVKNCPLVFPNPSGGNMQLTLPGTSVSQIKVEFYNMLGSLVYSASFDKTLGASVPLSLSYLPKGVYLLKARDGSVVYEEKVMIN
jgi:hypothetical protein